MSYLVNPLWPVQDSFPNQFEHDAQTISDNTHVPQSPYQTPPPTYSPRDDFASDLAIQEQAYQAQFANFLNQNFFRDIFQSGSLDSVQNRGIYNGGMVTQVSTQSNVNPSLNIEQRSNYPSASMPDISFVSPSHMERSDSSASNPGSDNVNDLLQYQWDGFGPRDGSAGQVQQVNPNSNYFIDKIEFPSGSNDHIIIELNQTPNYSTEPTGTNIIDMKSPADILYGSGGFQCVESQPSIFDPSSSSMPFISQPQSSTHYVDEDHEEDTERQVAYPAGSVEQTKALASSRFMKQMREQIKLLKAAHGPIVTQPPSSYPKVTEDRRSKGGKISQPQRRHIKKDDTVQVSGIPDTIAMDLSKLNPFGSFTFGCEAWTISFDRNPKFKKFFFEGKLKNMTEEILTQCLGEDLSLFTLTGSSYIQREISEIHQPVQKISGLKSPVPEVLRWSIVSFFENFIPREKLPPKLDHEKMVRSFISKICSRDQYYKTFCP